MAPMLQGQFANQLPELVNAPGYKIESVTKGGGERGDWVVGVSIGSVREQRFEFHLATKTVGTHKGALMTKMICKLE